MSTLRSKPMHFMAASGLLALLYISMALTGCVHADASGHHMGEAVVVNQRCPMLGSPIDPSKVPPQLQLEFQGKKVGFCCQACKDHWQKLSVVDREAKLRTSMAAHGKKHAHHRKGKQCAEYGKCDEKSAGHHKAKCCSDGDMKNCGDMDKKSHQSCTAQKQREHKHCDSQKCDSKKCGHKSCKDEKCSEQKCDHKGCDQASCEKKQCPKSDDKCDKQSKSCCGKDAGKK